ncbi:MAG TPA: IPT/TIG domain-containing protein, partial [Puia sp.]|nr:IPT/TIG domain-containing protein [Puia sp.]
MKNSLQLSKILFILILLPALFQGCAKKYDNAFNDLPLTIDSIVPSSGSAGTPVRIYGQGFAYPAANNKVFFNGVQATVDSNTVLGVLLSYAPAKGTTGNLSVEAVPYHDSAAGPVFTYFSIPAPVITDVEYNGLFEILGQHFDPTASIVAIAGQVVSGFSYADYGNGTAALTKASYTPPLALDNPVQVTVTVNGVSSAPYTYLFYPRVSQVTPDTVYYNATVTLQG